MAFAATTHWEVQTGGVDGTTGNGGGFNPANASMATDLAATSGTTTAPVVTSATYNFAARDVGAWLFVKSGTNWLPGWYQIASVAANAATLTATIGAGVLLSTLAPTTAAGCATTASPTSGTWSIDYSQSAGAGITYTDLLIAVTTTDFTSAANPVGPNIVGNVIAISSGVNFTVQRVQIVSVSGTTATCDKSMGTAAAANGNGILGGALASPGQAGALMVINGNVMWIKSGTYTIASATLNIATGCVSLPSGSSTNASKMVGYGSVRGDMGTRPLLQASGISTFNTITCAANNCVMNLVVDGASLTTSRGVFLNNTSLTICYLLKVINCTNSGIIGGTSGSAHSAILCEATGCSGVPAFRDAKFFGCVAQNNAAGGFLFGVANSAVNCISANNTGSGFSSNTTVGIVYYNCTSYGNSTSGFSFSNGQSGTIENAINCLAVNNGTYGFTTSNVGDAYSLFNCAGFNNTSGLVDTTKIRPANTFGLVTLTADPFVNAAGNDFSLNNTAGGGILCKAAGIPGALASNQFPGLSTLSYPDIGAVQGSDLAPVGGGLIVGQANKRSSSY